MPVVLLCHCDGVNGQTTFTDSSSYAHTLIPVNSPLVSTANPKFGTGAMTSAVNTRLITSAAPEFVFTGQFTVECWGYLTSSLAASQGSLLTQWNTFSHTSGWGPFNLTISNNTLYFQVSPDSVATTTISGAYTPTLNTWVHYAADRDASNVIRLYANGVVIGTPVTLAGTLQAASPYNITIGGDDDGLKGWPGQIDEVRITTGLARYAGAFTPPTAPFADTSALATQVAAEHWLRTNPQAQVTQIALEWWGSVGTIGPVRPTAMLAASRAGLGSVVVGNDSVARTVNLANVGVAGTPSYVPPSPPGGGAQARAMILA